MVLYHFFICSAVQHYNKLDAKIDLRWLNIYLGDMKDAIYHPPTYFDNQYEDEWLTDKTAIQMIRDVDHSEVISARLIDSPVLGPR